MPNSEVLILFVNLCVVALAMPQENVPPTEEPTGFLPFLQFTNGGVRVNFAGFHAQAGLGGLLTGDRAGGGLHASAGTPWGANAAAGLGGLLAGDNANAGGGLYARAGLGDGLPQARAGLGGILDGSGRSNAPAMGGLYAGATTGNFGRSVGVGVDNIPPGEPAAPRPASASASSNASGSGTADARASGHTNIQIVPKGASKKRNEVKPEAVAKVAVNPEKSESTNVEAKREETIERIIPGPSASVILSGAVTAGGPTVTKSIQKVKVSNEQVDTVQSALVPPPPSSASISPPVITDNRIYTIEKRPRRPHWYYRKRLRAGVPKKQVIVTETQHADAPFDVPPAPPAADITAAASGTVYKSYDVDGKVFDDIFNIPISTLYAVNKLLKNNVG